MWSRSNTTLDTYLDLDNSRSDWKMTCTWQENFHFYKSNQYQANGTEDKKKSNQMSTHNNLYTWQINGQLKNVIWHTLYILYNKTEFTSTMEHNYRKGCWLVNSTWTQATTCKFGSVHCFICLQAKKES